MASFNVAPSDKFSFKPNDWPEWKIRFERTQVVPLSYSMSEGANEIFSALPMTADERKKYDNAKSKLEEHFIIKRNVIFERAKLDFRFQKENESVDNFITDLFPLAEHCNYRNLHDEMVLDRIRVGLKDKAPSEELQQGIIRQEGFSASNVNTVKSNRPRLKINSSLK